MEEDTTRNKVKMRDKIDKGIQAIVLSENTVHFQISLFTLWWLSVLIAIVSMTFGAYFYMNYSSKEDQEQIALSFIGVKGVQTFNRYDRDGDGYLSVHEFEPIYHKMNEFDNETYEYSAEIEEGVEVLTLQSFFEPLRLETMSKDNNTMFGHNLDALVGLKSWRVAKMAFQNFGASVFKVFLPPNEQSESTHIPYKLIEKINLKGQSRSSNRYYPPFYEKEGEILIHRLLTMFHDRPFIYSRFEPEGAIACVRASNENYLDIVFRIHAEFQLNEPPFHPFWFTPAQFTGHVTLDKTSSKVLDFHMYVPNEKRLNVDMEWLNGPLETDMEVDIGFMNQMELKSTGPSLLGVSLDEVRISADMNLDIKWDNEITFQSAAKIVEREFYMFKMVDYLNFSQVWPEAQMQQKPVHSILLWGALDDQSC